MERRPRRSRKEKLEEELLKTEEAIESYKRGIVTMEKKKQELEELLEQERIREVTRLLEQKHMSVDQLKDLIVTMELPEGQEMGA